MITSERRLKVCLRPRTMVGKKLRGPCSGVNALRRGRVTRSLFSGTPQVRVSGFPTMRLAAQVSLKSGFCVINPRFILIWRN